MKNPTFIQIDSGIYGDAKVNILMRKHGALGIAIFIYSLIQINHNPDTGLLIDNIFLECAAVQHNADIDDVSVVIDELIKLGLLYEDSGLYHSIGYDKRTGTYIEANIKRSETQKQNAADKANDQAKAKAPAKANPPKPVVKESLIPESEQITRLRGYAKAIFDELGNCKNKPELTTEQYQKLIDKWGFDKLVVLQRIYYEWKASLAKKHTHTDFGTLNKKCWVHEKADKDDGCQEQYESGNTPTPDQRPNPPAGGWPYPFPKPKGFDEMEFYAKRDLLSKLMQEYQAAQEAKNPKPVKAPEPPKEEVWKYDFPKPEHWDGMKQAAKDAYIARELMKEAQDVINSLPH